MQLQVIKDGQGKDSGVFIPMKDWMFIKNNYPDIEALDHDIPKWEKDLIDKRLDAIGKNPERLRPGDELLNELRQKI